MTVCEIETLRARRTALKAELVRLNRTLKPYDADASCPALERRDFWKHPDVAETFAAYIAARDAFGCFSPATSAALAAYTRAAFGGKAPLAVFKARLDRGIAGRVSA